jgi:hypothetical protein
MILDNGAVSLVQNAFGAKDISVTTLERIAIVGDFSVTHVKFGKPWYSKL